MSRAEFDAYYQREQLPCLSSVKERHWQTWLEAQATLLSAHGPAVELKVLDESYSKGWKDCMEIVKK